VREELRKISIKRVWLAWAFLTGWLLCDEYIKEGYLFNVHEVLMFGTHEFFIFALTVVSIATTILNILRSRKSDRR